MLSVRFEPPAAKYIKKLKDKKLKTLYREAIDKICNDYTIGVLLDFAKKIGIIIIKKQRNQATKQKRNRWPYFCIE